MRLHPKKLGFTLAELLLVIALIIIILLIFLLNFRKQIVKSHDIQRKTHITKIQKSLEEYFNDKQCYPTSSPITNCGSTDLSPYMSKVPCDPVLKTPYLFVPGTPTACEGYHACAKLEDLSDPDIARIGCDPVTGCGWGAGYNYCIAMGSSVTAPGFVPGQGTPTPTEHPTLSPTATPKPGQWACTPLGACDNYADPIGAGCPVTYDTQCIYQGTFQCGDPANRCARSY